MKQRMGERVHGDLRQIFFFFTSKNQLASYYHLTLLMSLAGKTKLLSIPPQTALWSRSRESFGVWRASEDAF